jgi:membrane-anchored mycosin MYCP
VRHVPLVLVALAVALTGPIPVVASPALVSSAAVPSTAASDTGPPPPSGRAGCRPAPGRPTARGDVPPGRTATERLRLATVHALATGRGQAVAVIDTGVAPHPRLAGRLVGLGDYLEGGDGLEDCDGHGTAVAGIIGAAVDPGDDLVGVAPDARILAVRQFSPSISGQDGQPAGDLPSLADALVLAVRRGADVVNISGAVCVPAAQVDLVGAPVRAALDLAVREDVVVVAAAGNAGGGGCAADAPGQVSLPGWFGDDLLTVGAVDPDDRPAPFTVRGPWVDVAAPGTAVDSLSVDGGTGAPLDGTSFAAPSVAGLAALIRERRPDLSAREVADRITATARRPAGGRDDAVGFGVVDPVAALTAEPAVLHPGPVNPAATVVLPRSTPVARPVWPVGALALLAAAATALAAPRSRVGPRR